MCVCVCGGYAGGRPSGVPGGLRTLMSMSMSMSRPLVPRSCHGWRAYSTMKSASKTASSLPRPPVPMPATLAPLTPRSTLPWAVPDAVPARDDEINSVAQMMREARGKCLVICGAGMSTESGIPDYRSPRGAYSVSGWKPMTHQDFMKTDAMRTRYWARSYAGWPFISTRAPSLAHASLAHLAMHGAVMRPIITQNVDRLHHAARAQVTSSFQHVPGTTIEGGAKGDGHVLELHGALHEVICMSCGNRTHRDHLQQEFSSLNPAAFEVMKERERRRELLLANSPDGGAAAVVRPDGDVDLPPEAMRTFQYPSCQSCGTATGILKPAVTFFGDNVHPDVSRAAAEASETCEAVLVLGSSLSTFSALRLVRKANERGKPVALVGVGDSRADGIASLSLRARVGDVLPRLRDKVVVG